MNRIPLLDHPVFRDYGMVAILIGLAVFFSAVTIAEQHPTGEDAGGQVANMILDRHGNRARVLIIARATSEDRSFTLTVANRLTAAGATVVAEVNGDATDAFDAIGKVLQSGGAIDAIAATSVTAQWTVFDRFPSVGSSKCVVAQPYTWPNFLKLSNLLSVANQTAIY